MTRHCLWGEVMPLTLILYGGTAHSMKANPEQ